MANILAAQNGNWSNSSTWIGGVIPTSVDLVYSNNRTVIIDTNITVSKISNKAENGATAGGKFTLNDGVIVTANIEAGTVACVDTANGASCIINGNITGGSALAGRGLDNTSTGTISISGNVTGGAASYSTGTNFAEGVRNSSTGSISITGTVAAGSSFGRNYGLLNFSTGSVTITGNLSGGSIANAISVVNYGGGSITVNGNCYGSNAAAVYSETTSFGGTVTINGDCFGASNAGTVAAIFNNSPSDTYQIYGNCLGGTGTGNSQFAINNNSSGTINIVGNCTAGYNPVGNTAAGKYAVSNTASGTVNIVGTIYGAPKTNTGVWTVAGQSYAVLNNGSGVVNITGDVYGSSSAAVYNNGSGSINVTGNSYISTTPLDFGNVNNGSTAITNVGIGTINITGNVYGSDIVTHTNSITVNNNSTGTININGICYAGLTCSAARNSSSGVLDVKRAVGNIFGNPQTTGQVLASYGVHSNVNTSITYVEEIQFGSRGNTPINGVIYPKLNSGLKVIFTNQGNSSETTLIDPTSAIGLYPLSSDVRFGVSYAAGNLTGSCYVPSPSSVSYNIPVDNTVGQAILSIDNLLNFDVQEIGSNSIWKRLKNCSTVSSTGSQLASLI